MAEVKELTVGMLRMQCALMDADTPVQLVGLEGILKDLFLTECYPDATDKNGKWSRTFTIVVAASATPAR